jgi:dTDP-4-dehydrorhamnose 3,5-epimerase
VQVRTTGIPGLLVLTPRVFADQRAFSWKPTAARPWPSAAWPASSCRTTTPCPGRRSAARLHFQAPPSAQAKLVRVSRGAVYDVAVDLRVGSPAYGTWHAETLTADNHAQMFIPAGCAHGYATLAPDTEFQYKVDAYYDPARDAASCGTTRTWASPGP